MATIRLDKFLADAGIGTRSGVKKEIKKGLITINGELAKKPEEKVNPDKDIITYSGTEIHFHKYKYYILNKPAGYVSATKDNCAPTVLSLISDNPEDLFPVGRLDKNTEGFLLLTNDGAFSHYLLSPKHHVNKTYFAIVRGEVTKQDIDAFAKGLYIGDEDLDTAMPALLSYFPYEDALQKQPLLPQYLETLNLTEEPGLLSYIEVTLHEGKFHQVKRMFHAVGKEVLYLKRTHFANLPLPDDLAPGESRPLTPSELQSLQQESRYHFSNLKC